MQTTSTAHSIMSMDHSKRLPPGQIKPNPRKERLHQAPGSSAHSLRSEYGRMQGARGETRGPRGSSNKPAGSRDESPSRFPLPRQPAPPQQGMMSSPASQLQSQLQQHSAELTAKMPIPDLLQRVRGLGFPGSCSFVLTQIDRYLRAQVSGDAGNKGSVPSKETLVALIDNFVLYKQGPKSSFGRLTSLEEMHLLLAIRVQLEEQPSLELRYCLFVALFGEPGSNSQQKVYLDAAQMSASIFYKLVSSAVSLESGSILPCVALWMQCHSSEALVLAKSLYYDFCILLPNAMDPLLNLASTSPYLAHQLALAFTTLHPFHLVGSTAAVADPAHLLPPIRLLEIISHWVETCSDFLCPSQLLDWKSELPFLHSQKPIPHSANASLLAGLVQWSVLAPLVPEGVYKHHREREKRAKPFTSKLDTVREKNEKAGLIPRATKTDFAPLLSQLHANLLSIVLSQSKSFRQRSVTGDHVAVIVAALLGLKQRRGGGTQLAARMDESVERLAQFLQISLSAGLLSLSPDDLSSIATTLPANRLLDLVITHQKQSTVRT